MSKAKTLATTVSTGGVLENPSAIPAADIDGLATVATSGAYSDLSGKPTSIATATNLAGGGAGQIPYQSASGTTAMLAAGTSGQVLTSSGESAPTWADATSISVDGPSTSSDLYTGTEYTFTITNFDILTTYTLSSTNGTITRSGATLTYTPASAGSAGFVINGRSISGYTAVLNPTGQQAYTTPGTYSFVVPSGVLSVCAVVVGGGAAGENNADGAGGGGGALAYKNALTVTPGSTITVVVGAGGTPSTSQSTCYGGASSITYGATTVTAQGGFIASFGSDGWSTAATYSGGTGGGNGGRGYHRASRRQGGGGAGGYSGAGGDGSIAYTSPETQAQAGSGGGGGGGSVAPTEGIAGGGGGVGILGQGSNGAAATWSDTNCNGKGGSGGANGTIAATPSGPTGGAYGGGGAGGRDTLSGGAGGGGAVRIIWGPNRAFPSTNTGDL